MFQLKAKLPQEIAEKWPTVCSIIAVYPPLTPVWSTGQLANPNGPSHTNELPLTYHTQVVGLDHVAVG
ncbi:hypothetical protein AAFX19_14190 [Vibrio harveyi]|uniref:hypothetical protein n=1 Tax=Vibrio harveyi TaxID=669 RepID=UPI0038CD8F4B